MTYEYVAEVVRVIDGDTVVLKVTKEIDFGFYVKLSQSYQSSFRLYGLNTPEIYGVTLEEKAKGEAAKAELERLLALGPVRAVTYKADKYGRFLVDLYVKLEDGLELFINTELIINGFAVPYKLVL